LLAESGATFSNAAGGQLILRADNIANINCWATRLSTSHNLIPGRHVDVSDADPVPRMCSQPGRRRAKRRQSRGDGGVVNAAA